MVKEESLIMETKVLDKFGNVLSVGDTVVGILTLNQKVVTHSPQTINITKYRKGRTMLSKGTVQKFSDTHDKSKIYINWHDTGETTRIFLDRVCKIEENNSA